MLDVMILIRFVFEDDGTYYSQIFLKEELQDEENYDRVFAVKSIT